MASIKVAIISPFNSCDRDIYSVGQELKDNEVSRFSDFVSELWKKLLQTLTTWYDEFMLVVQKVFRKGFLVVKFTALAIVAIVGLALMISIAYEIVKAYRIRERQKRVFREREEEWERRQRPEQSREYPSTAQRQIKGEYQSAEPDLADRRQDWHHPSSRFYPSSSQNLQASLGLEQYILCAEREIGRPGCRKRRYWKSFVAELQKSVSTPIFELGRHQLSMSDLENCSDHPKRIFRLLSRLSLAQGLTKIMIYLERLQ